MEFRISIAVAILSLLAGIAPGFGSTVGSAPVSMHAVELRCEHLVNPLGIDEPRPVLSWEIQSTARGEMQTAYQVLVSSSLDGLASDQGDLWDTGKVKSDQSIEIPYRGTVLVSGQEAFWKVRFWDKDGNPSGWSDTGSWSVGLLKPADWSAQWIGKDEVPKSIKDQRLPARWMRKEFKIDQPLKRATVYMSGLGLSELYVNGEKVGNEVLSPALSDYTKRVYYVSHDVTQSLKTGANAVGAVLGNGRFFTPRLDGHGKATNYGFPKLLFQMRLEFADGTTRTITSDPTWKLSSDGPILANNEYDGEEYDARREMPGWSQSGFDDSSWAPAQVVQAPAGAMAAAQLEPIRVTGVLYPVAMNSPEPGVVIFDMGQNMVGWCRLKVSGPAGTQVSMRFAETLQPDGTLYLANIRGAKVTDVYTLRGDGDESWEPRFTYHGFRYVEVKGFPGNPSLDSIAGHVVNDDLESAGDFACSEPLLNTIYHNVVWGVRGNYRSMPTDCPQRDERMGWMGDRSAECLGESFIFRNRPLYAKWIQDMADAQHADGSVPDVCPAYWPLYNDDVTWPSTFVIAPVMLLDQYGDKQTLARQYPQMVKWMKHMTKYIEDDLMPKDKYGDWCVPPEDPKLIHSKDPARQTAAPILGTTYYFYCLQLMTRCAKLLDHPVDAYRFTELAERMKSGLNRKYLDAARARYDNGAQTTSVLPLAFGMVPQDEQRPVFDQLVDNITRTTNNHVGTGLVGGQWLNRVLSDNGRPDLALRLATNRTYPSWGYMVDHGATTIWELWNGNTADPAMNSGNHVMLVGDLVIWFYEYLAGIRSDPAAPGFKHIIMSPTVTGDLKFVSATHHGPYGTIASTWRLDGRRFKWDLTIPPNSNATLTLPAKSVDVVREGDKPVSASGDMKDIRFKSGNLTVEVGSGAYHFLSEKPD